jgi:hypothetical protein
MAPPPYSHGLEAQAPAPIQPEPKASKSLLGKLLKRSPKPKAVSPEAVNIPAVAAPVINAPAVKKPLINKNFILGGAVGFIGAFAVMIGLGMFGVETPQSYAANSAAPLPDIAAPQDASTYSYGNEDAASSAAASSAANGDTFLDNAIAENAP